MTSAPQSPPPRRRLGPGLFVGLGLAGAAAAAVIAARSSRAEETARARAQAGAELAAFERCLVGAPLAPKESLADRTRGVELAIALADAPVEIDDPELSSISASSYALARARAIARGDRVDDEPDAGSDAGSDADAGSTADAPPAKPPWPARCAPLATALARSLESRALLADRSLDALRDALPTSARLEMPYALWPDEAEDLTGAIAKAALPAPASAPSNEAPPPPLAAPLSGRDLKPLGSGKLPLSTSIYFGDRDAATDALETRALRLLIRGSQSGGRLCALDADDPRGAYATARCGDLPADYRNDMRLANLEDGAPLAILASKRAGSGGASSWAGGVVVFTPSGKKTLPIPSGASGASAFFGKDGSYMITSGAYLSFVRIGDVAKIKTTDLADTPMDTETAQALSPDGPTAIPAYGHVFWMDRPPLYTSYDPDRSLYSRRVLPRLEGSPSSIGEAPGNNLTFQGGCQAEGRRALLFGSDKQRNYGKERDQEVEKATIAVAFAEGDGPYKRLDAKVRATAAHIHCGKEAVFITSVGPAKQPGAIIVVESRCTAAGCEARSSDPIPVPGGSQIDAASIDGAVVLVWKLRADLVTSPARGMAFYRAAPIEAIATAPPRPLIENKRRGGLDIDAIHLIPRGAAAVVALESGGKTPVTYAARIDATGTASLISMEETQW